MEQMDPPGKMVPEPTRDRASNTKKLLYAILILVLYFAAELIVSPIIVDWMAPFSEPMEAVVLMPTVTISVVEVTDSAGVEMVYVPPGEFIMGDNRGDGDEKPARIVFLDAFYIDKYEVTNANYRVCVEAGACMQPTSFISYSRPSYYDNVDFDDYPVVYVNWSMAKNYCEWRGAYLPTEAQWEKAARGLDGRVYPWGEDSIDCSRANYYQQDGTQFTACVGDTARVGSFENGKSPYGAYDMSGNVWEWVSDWYDENYFKSSPSANPGGPDANRERVIRGGAWLFTDYVVRASNRYWYNPENAYDNIGFRCARMTSP